jgi:hypothetical protein
LVRTAATRAPLAILRLLAQQLLAEFQRLEEGGFRFRKLAPVGPAGGLGTEECEYPRSLGARFPGSEHACGNPSADGGLREALTGQTTSARSLFNRVAHNQKRKSKMKMKIRKRIKSKSKSRTGGERRAPVFS